MILKVWPRNPNPVYTWTIAEAITVLLPAPLAKCNSFRKVYTYLPDTPIAITSSSGYFQMLPDTPEALHSA